MTSALSHRLRTETADLHRLAERSGIMHGLLRGQLDQREYVDLLRGLFDVYSALEQRLDHEADHPAVGPFHHRALFRAAALDADLTLLHGVAWRTDVVPHPAAVAYADRIREATPAQLVAHTYVRYLGDLSGGQALARVIARALSLAGDDGVAFYRFEAIPDAERFKDEFRAALDAWPLSGAEADDVVREAQEAFRLNVRVFEAVGTRTVPSAAPLPPPGA